MGQVDTHKLGEDVSNENLVIDATHQVHWYDRSGFFFENLLGEEGTSIHFPSPRCCRSNQFLAIMLLYISWHKTKIQVF